jgi:NAD(P)-dependent dehydrogenase (short-subunit alcohol dehydrogenase family)
MYYTSQMKLLLFLPALSLSYAVIVAIFRWMWGEAPLQTLLKATLPSLGTLVVALAIMDQSDNRHQPLLVTIAINAYSIYLLYKTRAIEAAGGPAPTIPTMTGKIVVITGANAGIGYETARALYLHGATVYMACRSLEKATTAKQTITRGADDNRIRLLELDLCSYESIRKAAKQLDNVHIDILINNAGIMMSEQSFTVDGHELVMQANHLGHYLWTRLIQQKQSPRILNLTSSTYTLIQAMPLDDLFCIKSRSYSLFTQYAASKLANILFTRALRDRGCDARAVHPGLVRTNVTRHMPWYLYYPNTIFAAALWTLQKNPAQGAWCSLAVCVVEPSNNRNFYYVNQKPQSLPAYANDSAVAEKLWTISAKLVGMSET